MSNEDSSTNAPSIDPIRAILADPNTRRYLAEREAERKAIQAAQRGTWTATACEISPNAAGYEKFRQALTVMVENMDTDERFPMCLVDTAYLPDKPLNAWMPEARSVVATGRSRHAALLAWGRALSDLTDPDTGLGLIVQENPPAVETKPRRRKAATLVSELIEEEYGDE